MINDLEKENKTLKDEIKNIKINNYIVAKQNYELSEHVKCLKSIIKKLKGE